MHNSGGAACGRDDDGAPELCVSRSLRISKINEIAPPVNTRMKNWSRNPPLCHAADFCSAGAPLCGVLVSGDCWHGGRGGKILLLPLFGLAVETSSQCAESDTKRNPSQGGAMAEKVRKDDSAWKKELTQNQYFVTRKKGTEPPFTGEYEDTETAGTYK